MSAAASPSAGSAAERVIKQYAPAGALGRATSSGGMGASAEVHSANAFALLYGFTKDYQARSKAPSGRAGGGDAVGRPSRRISVPYRAPLPAARPSSRRSRVSGHIRPGLIRKRGGVASA